MNKKIIISILILLSFGCATTRPSDTFTLNKVLSLKVDHTPESEALEKFGQPNTKNTLNSETTWTYNDPKAGDQRLVLTFSFKHSLNSILWIPKTEDAEKELSAVIAQFPKLKIEPIDENLTNAHSPVGDITYRDEASGQVVLANEARSKVTAIAWYSPSVRDAAGAVESKKLHYSIGK